MAKKTSTTKLDKKLQPKRTYDLKLTHSELLHLRDLFSILLPPEGAQTVSQALAVAERRPFTETALWAQVSKRCREAKIPLDNEAPDFVVATVGAPTMSVFKIDAEPDDDDETYEDDDCGPGVFNQPDAVATVEPTETPKKSPRAKKAGAKGKVP